MSAKTKRNNASTRNKKAQKAAKKAAITNYKNMQKEARADDYWELSLPMRIYLRIVYATGGFIGTVYVFSMYTAWGIIPQIIFASLVALSILLYRVAFPNGVKIGNIHEWISQGIYEAALENELLGKKVKKSSEDIKMELIKQGCSIEALEEIEEKVKKEVKEKAANNK